MGPYAGMIDYIEQHAGWSVDVYMHNEEDPWELNRIEVIIETPSTVFIGGTILEGVDRPLLNLAHVSCIMFCQPGGDDKGRHDIPEPEKKNPMLPISIAVNG